MTKPTSRTQPPDLVSGPLSPKNQAWLTEQQNKAKKRKPVTPLIDRVEQLERQVEWLTKQLSITNEMIR